MSGINWTMKALNQLFPKSTIKLPFDSGLLKKGNYEKWLSDIKALQSWSAFHNSNFFQKINIPVVINSPLT